MLLEDNLRLNEGCFCGSQRLFKFAIFLSCVIRAILGLAYPYNTLHDLVKLIIRTVTIVYTNWWRSKDEPFITSCSYIMSFLCWVVWLKMCAVIVFFTGIIIIDFIKSLRRVGLCNMMKTFCECLYWSGILYIGFILGYSPEVY